jgi:ligand-binding SRPBCC domain-containing protein
MNRIVRSIEIEAPVEQVFEFHLNPRNVVRTAPPASEAVLVRCTHEVLQLATRIAVRSRHAGLPVTLEVEVLDLDRPRLLRDRQVSGPFAHWIHTYRFEPTPRGTRLTDDVEYDTPLGALSRFILSHRIARELATALECRLARTRRILEQQAAR